jgi:ATP-dependent Clp protease ATP-binding subunit ClpA
MSSPDSTSESDASLPDLFHPNGRVRLEYFNEKVARSLRAALDAARTTCWQSLRSPHLFIGLLQEPDEPVREWADRAAIDLPKLCKEFMELFDESDRLPPQTLTLHREFVSDHVLRLLRRALQRARDHDRNEINGMDLLLTVLTASPSVVAECLRRGGHKPRRLIRLAAEMDAGR